MAIGLKILCVAYDVIKDKQEYKELGYDFLMERKQKNKIVFMTQQLKTFRYKVEKLIVA